MRQKRSLLTVPRTLEYTVDYYAVPGRPLQAAPRAQAPRRQYGATLARSTGSIQTVALSLLFLLILSLVADWNSPDHSVRSLAWTGYDSLSPDRHPVQPPRTRTPSFRESRPILDEGFHKVGDREEDSVQLSTITVPGSTLPGRQATSWDASAAIPRHVLIPPSRAPPLG